MYATPVFAIPRIGIAQSVCLLSGVAARLRPAACAGSTTSELHLGNSIGPPVHPLLKQKLTLWDVIGGTVSYAGVFVISTRGDIMGFKFSNPLGVGLALFSSFLWALYWIFNKRDTRDPGSGNVFKFCFCIAFCPDNLHRIFRYGGSIYRD